MDFRVTVFNIETGIRSSLFCLGIVQVPKKIKSVLSIFCVHNFLVTYLFDNLIGNEMASTFISCVSTYLFNLIFLNFPGWPVCSTPIQVKNIGFTGVFRLIFKPLVEELPCFGAVCYSLKEKVRFLWYLWYWNKRSSTLRKSMNVSVNIIEAYELVIKHCPL